VNPTDNLLIAVVLGGVETRLRLGERRPALGEERIAAFERELGHRLPEQYRAFLLTYNGGVPVVRTFTPSGADAADPYATHEVRQFLGLSTAPEADDVPAHSHLRPSKVHQVHPSGLPEDVLEIAHDDFGNLFVIRLAGPRPGEILFIDHEEDVDLNTAPVVANDILDLLLRFRTVERQSELDRNEREAIRVALEHGSLPAALSRQIKRTGRDPAAVEAAIRRASMDVFNDKGHFSLHDDASSHAVFDLAAWLASASRRSPGLERDNMHEAVSDWSRDDDDGFGLRGIAPGYIDIWWDKRLAEGLLEPVGKSKVRLSETYVDTLLTRLR
jgi:hypothetical protein